MDPTTPEEKQEFNSNADGEKPSPASPQSDTSPALSSRRPSPLPGPPSDPGVRPSPQPQPESPFMKTVEQKLSLHSAKEELITRSLVELESRISTLERSLLDLKKSQALSSPPGERMGREHPGSPTADGLSTSAPARAEQEPGGGSAQAAVQTSARKSTSADDFSPPDPTALDEGINFFSEPLDDFDAPFDKENLLLQGNRTERPGGDKKRSFFLLLPIAFLLVLFSALVYYYNSLQKQTNQKLTITENITLTSVPASTVEVSAEQTVKPPPDELQEDIRTAAPLSPPPPQAAPEGAEGVSQAKMLQQKPQKTSAQFTVSVGSFKDKANAIALTSKLTNQGYPALMTQLQKKQLFRVCVGSFATRDDAVAMARVLAKKEKLPTAIVSTTAP